MSNSPDSALLTVYQQYARSGLGGDLRFVDAVFTVLRKHTSLLSTDQSIEQVQQLAIKHCEIGKKERAAAKKAATNQSTSQPTNQSSTTSFQSSSQSSSESSSQSTSQSTNQSTSQSANPSAEQSTNQSTNQLSNQSTDEPPVTSHQPTGDAPINNGGKTDKYTWSQTLGDVTASLSINQSITSKQLTVKIGPDHVSIINKSTNEVLIDGDWHSRVLADDATWTLEPSTNQSKILSLYLPKADRMQWWSCLIKGDQSIDITKIQPENSQLSDLDSDTRKTVEKMMFDQRAKQTGMKTSDELTKEQALKRFMDLHPEMDFSQAKML